MGLIPENEIEQVRSRADIVAVIGERIPLKRAGRNLKANCPFHAEKTPSFMVNPEKQIYHCFGCGEGGDVFRFLMKHDGVAFVEAVEKLADRFGVALTSNREDASEFQKKREIKEQAWKINRLAARFFFKQLTHPQQGLRGREYLARRHLDLKVAEECFLGYAPADGQALTEFLRAQQIPLSLAAQLGLVRQREREQGYYDFFRDRLLFTILSPDGKVLGFSGRALGEEQQPKYLNSPDSIVYNKSASMLGLNLAAEAIREEKRVILVEGNVDWLRLVQEGIRHVVAPLGTALTDRQIQVLSRLASDFVLLFDGDAAGLHAAERALELFLPLGIFPRTVVLPAGEDPDSYVQKEGIGSLKAQLQEAPYLLDVMLDRISEQARGLPDRSREIQRVGRLLGKLPGNVEKTIYIQRVADKFGLPERVLWETLRGRPDSGRPDLSARHSNFSPPPAETIVKKLPPIEKALVEILFSNQVDPGPLLEEIDGCEFSHPLLRDLWKLCRDQWKPESGKPESGKGRGKIHVAALLDQAADEDQRRLISGLAFSSELWSDSGPQAAEDCLKRFRQERVKGKLRNLSDEIRSAEGKHDWNLLKRLVEEKNIILKEMGPLH